MKVVFDIGQNVADVADNLHLLDEQQLIEQAIGIYGAYETMRLADFLHYLSQDYSWFCKLETMSVAQYYWLLGLKNYTEDFCKALNRLTIPATAREKQIQTGCIDNTFEQGALLFCQDYFHLPSFDIGDLRVWEFLLAKQNRYNQDVCRRNELNMIKKGQKK